MAGLHEVGQNRLQDIDGHEHVTWQLRLGVVRFTDDQRTDADQLAVAIDQCRAAPVHRRRARVDRVIELIFPAAGEEPFRYDPCERRAVISGARDQHRIPFGDLARVAERNRRGVQRHDAADETEAARMIVSDDGRR